MSLSISKMLTDNIEVKLGLVVIEGRSGTIKKSINQKSKSEFI